MKSSARHIKASVSGIFLFLLLPCLAFSQHTVKKKKPTLFRRVKTAIVDICDDGICSLKRDPKRDSINRIRMEAAAQKSEKYFEPFEGKIIRNIFITQLGFESLFSDTTNTIAYWGTQALNATHTTTQEWVIRNNLFIKKNQPLSAYKISDNERFLRTLSFIQDARIKVRNIPGKADSVDVYIITKDLYSLSAVADADANTATLKLGDDNLGGMGQSVRLTALYGLQRDPRMGYEIKYGKNNIAGTFISGEIGYSQINTAARIGGSEQEKATFIRLSRPLVSPYAHLVGGLEISTNTSSNVFGKADSLFYKYHYDYFSAWAGYNLGNRRLLEKNTRIRERQFVALSYMNTKFSSIPYQIGENYDPIYNDKEAILGSLTFFKENFYKTSYIYGFGTTEDVPIGYNITLTGGWYRQQQLERPYAGIDISLFQGDNTGYFAHYYLRAGSFFHHSQMQDITFLAGIDAYSPLLNIGATRIRHYFKVSYSQIFERIIYAPLRIDNGFGIRDLTSSYPTGNERINVNNDIFCFTNLKVFGFKFAPFVFADFALLRAQGETISKATVYSAVGGGLRIRNENFVFGTIEARAIYLPVEVPGTDRFKINISSELRYRYRTDYIKAPGIIQLNEGL